MPNFQKKTLLLPVQIIILIYTLTTDMLPTADHKVVIGTSGRCRLKYCVRDH